MLSVH